MIRCANHRISILESYPNDSRSATCQLPEIFNRAKPVNYRPGCKTRMVFAVRVQVFRPVAVVLQGRQCTDQVFAGLEYNQHRALVVFAVQSLPYLIPATHCAPFTDSLVVCASELDGWIRCRHAFSKAWPPISCESRWVQN